jgi:hypothetical protein
MKQKRAEQLCLLSLLSEKQEGRFSPLQCNTPPPEPLLHLLLLFIKGLRKEGWGVFLLPFAFAFALGVVGALAWLFCFGLFVVGSFWKGKELLKEKELLKGNC